jgi:hypothetical protein
MARKPTWGTPTRTQHHPPLRRRWQFVAPAAIAGAVVMVGLLGSHVIGGRSALSPGSLTVGHATFDTSCEQCHTPAQGVSNVRCQRCHDPSSAGRLTTSAHVLFGSGDPRKAAAAPDVACAQCHVEHRGRSAPLSMVGDQQCAECHFGALRGHPEFAVLRASTKEAPGLKFGHKNHITDIKKQKGIASDAQTCGLCHVKSAPTRDFEPMVFEKHCAECHSKEGSVGTVDPVPLTEVADLEGLRAQGVAGASALEPETFEVSRGKVARTSVPHRDQWVLFNLNKLRAQTDPEAFAADRAKLEARIASLERRLAASTPMATLDKAGLEERAAALERESQGASQRMAAIAAAGEAPTGAARLEEVEARLQAAGDAAAAEEVSKLREAASASGPGPAPLPVADFEARRQEVLTLLQAVEAADPALKARTEDLRRRIVALVPGENPADLLKRVRDQRQASLDRLKDELSLREQGVAPPRASLLEAERSDLDRALAAARAQLAVLAAVPTGAALSPDDRSARRETAAVVAGACTKCHILGAGAMTPVRAARPVLVRAKFVHEPHLLQADCSSCHAGIEESKLSLDLNFKGIETCRECHRPLKARQDCMECHRFHPKAVP